MARTKIAIASQSGGSQTAFTAGALKPPCKAGVLFPESEVVRISGTHGGAMCAAPICHGFEKDEDPVRIRLMRFREGHTELQATLDFERKLDRSANNINHLLAEGEARARTFVKERRAILSASPRATEGGRR